MAKSLSAADTRECSVVGRNLRSGLEIQEVICRNNPEPMSEVVLRVDNGLLVARNRRCCRMQMTGRGRNSDDCDRSRVLNAMRARRVHMAADNARVRPGSTHYLVECWQDVLYCHGACGMGFQLLGIYSDFSIVGDPFRFESHPPKAGADEMVDASGKLSRTP